MLKACPAEQVSAVALHLLSFGKTQPLGAWKLQQRMGENLS